MRMNFAESVALVLKHEGGYSDHAKDPGGATNMGITRETLARWRDMQVTKADVKAMGRHEAEAIYKARYWDAVKGDDLPSGVDHAVFDAAVNSGPYRAAIWLQEAVKTRRDGKVGPMTLAAVMKRSEADVVRDVMTSRLAFMSATNRR